ncbi:putative glycosidase CRH2, partial [Coemansia sp. S100]
WVGKSPNEVQTNFFYHDILDYGNSEFFDVGANTATSYHDYTIDWTPDAVTWIVDGKTLRKLNRKDTYDSKTKEYKFPASEGRIGFSIWDGGNSGSDGTQKWAGTPTPWTPSTVYKMFVDSVQITCAKENPKPPVSSPSSSSSTASTSTTSTKSTKSTKSSTSSNTSVTSTTLTDTNSPTPTGSDPNPGNPSVKPPNSTDSEPGNPSVKPPNPTDPEPGNPEPSNPGPGPGPGPGPEPSNPGPGPEPSNPGPGPEPSNPGPGPEPSNPGPGPEPGNPGPGNPEPGNPGSGNPSVQPPTKPTPTDSNKKCYVVYRTVTV